MKTIDLHTHTTFSDGSSTPTQLFRYAKEKKLSAIAITDHDTISGLDEGSKAAKKYDVELINGIELSSFVAGIEVHILGYMFDKKSKTLLEGLEQIVQSRINRNYKMITKLNKIGVNINYEELLAESKNDIVARTQFASVLVKKGYAKDKEDAFKKYLAFDCDTYVPRKDMKAKNIISLINDSGGIPVLAHPLRYKIDLAKLNDIIQELISYGLKGVEVFYPNTSNEKIEYLKNMCLKNNLIITGGSDFHGLDKKKFDLGTGYNNDLCVPYSLLKNFKNNN